MPAALPVTLVFTDPTQSRLRSLLCLSAVNPKHTMVITRWLLVLVATQQARLTSLTVQGYRSTQILVLNLEAREHSRISHAG